MKNDRPFIAFGVRKRADPFVSSKLEKKRRHALALQTLRRKYQEQRLAKIRAVTIEKMNEGVKIKSKNLVRTRSVTKREADERKGKKIKIVTKQTVKITQTTVRTTSVKRPIIKQRMCLRSKGRFVPRELSTPIRTKIRRPIVKKKIVPSKQKKVASSSEFSSDDNEPLVRAVRKTTKIVPLKVMPAKIVKKPVMAPIKKEINEVKEKKLEKDIKEKKIDAKEKLEEKGIKEKKEERDIKLKKEDKEVKEKKEEKEAREKKEEKAKKEEKEIKEKIKLEEKDIKGKKEEKEIKGKKEEKEIKGKKEEKDIKGKKDEKEIKGKKEEKETKGKKEEKEFKGNKEEKDIKEKKDEKDMKIRITRTSAKTIETQEKVEALSPIPAQRPSRKTKEAAALYMNLLGPKLVTDPTIDDDDSIDSFPELPNVRRTERQEIEMKANVTTTNTRMTTRKSIETVKKKGGEKPKELPKKPALKEESESSEFEEAVEKKELRTKRVMRPELKVDKNDSFSESDEEPLVNLTTKKKVMKKSGMAEKKLELKAQVITKLTVEETVIKMKNDTKSFGPLSDDDDEKVMLIILRIKMLKFKYYF